MTTTIIFVVIKENSYKKSIVPKIESNVFIG